MSNRSQYLILLGIIVLHAGLAFFISRYAITYLPNTGDEHSIAFQAKIFASFKAAASPPPFKDSFRCHYMNIANDRWFSQYAPVYSLMISPGVLLGNLNAMVILYSSLSILVVFLLLKTVFRVGRDVEIILFCLFWSLCPTVLFHSASFYNHIGALLVYLFILLCYFKFVASQSKRFLWLSLLSLGFGLGVGIRPYTFFLLAIPLGVKLLFQLSKGSRLKMIAALAVPFSLILLALLIYNHYLTGGWTEITYLNAGNNYRKLSLDNFNLWSFRRVAGMVNETTKWLFASGYFGTGHLKGETVQDLNLSNIIAVAAFAYMIIRAFFRTEKGSSQRSLWQLALFSTALMVFGHIFYNYRSGRFGERFFFETVWMTALAFVFFVFDALSFARRLKGKRAVGAVVVVALMLPAAVWYTPQTARFFKKDNRIALDLFLRSRQMNLDNSVVHVVSVPRFDPSFYTRNRPDLSGTIYMTFSPAELDDITDYFKDRDHFAYQYDRREERTMLRPLAEFMAPFRRGRDQTKKAVNSNNSRGVSRGKL